MFGKFKKLFRGKKGEQTSLIANKADVNDCGDIYKTPIARAAYNGDIETAEMLIKAGADANEHIENWRMTPLMIAAEKGHVKMVEFLIANNAIINDQDLSRYTPLMFAAYEGHREIVEILIEAGANTSSLSYNGSTALSLAVQKGHTAVVELLQAEADKKADKKAEAEAAKLAAKAREPIFDWKNPNNPDEGITVSNIPEKETIYIKKGDIMSYLDSEHNKTTYIRIISFTPDVEGPPIVIKYLFYGYRKYNWEWLYDNGKPYLILPDKFGDYNNLVKTALTKTEAEAMAKDAAAAAAAAAKAKALEEEKEREARMSRRDSTAYLGMRPPSPTMRGGKRNSKGNRKTQKKRKTQPKKKPKKKSTKKR